MRLRTADRELLRLAVPAFGALIAEPLYVATDTAIIGHLGTTSLGGLAIASSVLFFTYGLCIFLAYGTTASISRLVGAGHSQRAAIQAIQGLWLAVFIGLSIALLGTLFADDLLHALGAKNQVLEEAATYLKISLLGAPAMLITLAGVGYLRGLSDAMRPLQVSIGTALFNLGLELILIYGLDLGIGASATATVIAQWLGAICYLNWIGREVRKEAITLKPELLALRNLMSISINLIIRNLCLTSTFLIGTSVATRIGDTDVAAHQVALQMWVVLALALDGIAIAAQTMVGTALGANKATQARHIGQRALIWSTGLGIALGGILFFCRHASALLFSTDPAVISLIKFLFIHVALMAPLSGIAFALDGILIGAGDQKFIGKAMAITALISIGTMIVGRIGSLGIGWLWGSIWILVLIRSVSLGIRFLGNRWVVLGVELRN